MPTQKSRLTKTEEQEYRRCLSFLEKRRIRIGPAGDPSPKPERLILEPINHGFARCLELPWDQVVVVAPVRMTVLTGGMLIVDCRMTTPWDDSLLELEHPEEWECYNNLIDGLQPLSLEVLNHQLTSHLPLPRREVEGVIFAKGGSKVPPERPDGTPIKVELLLRDEAGNEICAEFGVKLDRSLKRDWEERHEKQLAGWQVSDRTGLFGPNQRQPAGQKNASPEKPSSSREPAAALSQPVTQETRRPN